MSRYDREDEGALWALVQECMSDEEHGRVPESRKSTLVISGTQRADLAIGKKYQRTKCLMYWIRNSLNGPQWKKKSQK